MRAGGIVRLDFFGGVPDKVTTFVNSIEMDLILRRMAHLWHCTIPRKGVPSCVFGKGGRRCCQRNFCRFYTARCVCRRRMRPSQSTRRTGHPRPWWLLQFEGRATRPQNIAQHDAYETLTPIGLVPHPRIGSVWAASPGGKPAKSLAKVVSRTAGTTTFEVTLNSGRPHQIRIHLASIGHPLVGDPLYGVSGQPLENLPGLPGDGRYFLHARFLKFHHPITGEPINLEAALPSGFSLHQ
jgi:hypothetical protein